MPNVWSLNTTLRNPERLPEFLRVLQSLEGIEFNKEGQCLYFKMLIQNKLYQPIGLSTELKKAYEDLTPFDSDDTNEVYSYTKNRDLRGRTAVGTLNKTGVAIAKQSKGAIKITSLGKKLLNNEISLGEFYFRYFIKWQLPNPIETGYDDFNINPFIATLNIIHKVNEAELARGNSSKGVSKKEFSIFIIPLKDYKDIDNVVKEILLYRDSEIAANDSQVFYTKTLRNRVMEIFNFNDSTKEKDIQTKCNNLEDYADSAIRYFRLTGFIYYRGKGRYADISPTRLEEAKLLINNLCANSIIFNNEDDYINYLCNINLPKLDWENESSLIKVYNQLCENINSIQNEIQSTYPGKKLRTYTVKKINKINASIDIAILKQKISELRSNLKTLQNDLNILKERSLVNLPRYIEELNKLAVRKKALDGSGPLTLEWITALSLMALDDAKEIKPNLIIGDDGIPIFTASGNTADIECFYDSFNMTVEVTLMKNRDQAQNERQPVMRHLRDFENLYPNKQCYCIFIAPVLHRDTLNTFWMGVKYEYEGRQQKIIPMTLNQYTNILKIVLEKNKKGIRVNHRDIKSLLDSCSEIPITDGLTSVDWQSAIDNKITEWSKSKNKA